MVEASTGRSPLEEAAGAAGPHAIEAFKLLSDETRVAILLALWEAYDPDDEVHAVPFTELCHRVGADDTGNFAYHLGKLVDHFVEETDEGYALTNAGHKIVRAVIAGAGLEQAELEPTTVPRDCPWCGGQVELCYQDQRLYQACQRCDGGIGPDSTEQAPVGTLMIYDGFNPAGLTGRTAEEVFVAGTIDHHTTVSETIRGVCPDCSGPLEESLDLCEDHDTTDRAVCRSCGARDQVRARYICQVCKFHISFPAWAALYDHPEVVAFYRDHGFDMTYGLEDPEACGDLWNRMGAATTRTEGKTQSLLSRDPLRIRVSVFDDDEVLRLVVDEDLDVIEVSRETASAVEERARV